MSFSLETQAQEPLCMVAAMQDQAARAARLRALREAAQLDTPHQDAEPEAAGNAEPVLKFRNYVVKDDKISHEQTAAANPPDYEAPTAGPDLDAEGEVRAPVLTILIVIIS